MQVEKVIYARVSSEIDEHEKIYQYVFCEPFGECIYIAFVSFFEIVFILCFVSHWRMYLNCVL